MCNYFSIKCDRVRIFFPRYENRTLGRESMSAFFAEMIFWSTISYFEREYKNNIKQNISSKRWKKVIRNFIVKFVKIVTQLFRLFAYYPRVYKHIISIYSCFWTSMKSIIFPGRVKSRRRIELPNIFTIRRGLSWQQQLGFSGSSLTSNCTFRFWSRWKKYLY